MFLCCFVWYMFVFADLFVFCLTVVGVFVSCLLICIGCVGLFGFCYNCLLVGLVVCCLWWCVVVLLCVVVVDFVFCFVFVGYLKLNLICCCLGLWICFVMVGTVTVAMCLLICDLLLFAFVAYMFISGGLVSFGLFDWIVCLLGLLLWYFACLLVACLCLRICWTLRLVVGWLVDVWWCLCWLFGVLLLLLVWICDSVGCIVCTVLDVLFG